MFESKMWEALRTAAAALVLSLGATAPASACSYGDILDGSLSALHPRAMEIASATRDAVKAGVLDAQSAAPVVPGEARFSRSVVRIRALHQLLTEGGETSPFSLLFIDSNFWSRFAPSSDGLTAEWNLPGSRPGDVVVVTSETTIAAVLERKLSIAAALAHGLIVVDGESAEARIVYSMLLASDQTLESSEFGPLPLSERFGPGRTPAFPARP